MKFNLIYLALFCVFNLSGQEVGWANSTSIDAQTVFYQGMFSSQTQAAKYTGPCGFIATTGEKVVNGKGIITIQNLHVKPEIDEIILAPRKSIGWSDLTINPLAMLYGLGKRISYFATKRANSSYGTQVLPAERQDPDCTIAQYSLDFGKINIAQQGDINNYKKRFEDCVTSHPDNNIIAYGVSRGAATTFQVLAAFSKEQRDISKIKLCILEGCFDDVSSLMKTRYPYLLSSDWAQNTLAALASKIISYRIEGSSPIKEVDHFPKAVPVAFITSKADREVPSECTKRLANALYDAGHRDIYMLELERSSHPRYMFDDRDDADEYQNFVHALYKKYGLPYISSYAEQGSSLLTLYSSSDEEAKGDRG